MEALKDFIPSLWPSKALLVVAVLPLLFALLNARPSRKPPMLRDSIPYVTNTYQYMVHMDRILLRAAKVLGKSNIVGLHVGPKNVFLITGAQNIQNLLRNSPNVGFETFTLLAIRNMVGATPEDVAKFAKDKTGRLAGDAEPGQTRYWAGMHSVMQKYLSQSHFANALGTTYQQFFSEQLARFPVGEWTEISAVRLMKEDMARAAVLSLLGKRIFEVSPDILDLFWEYDKVLGTILYGPPRWLFKSVYATADRFCDAAGNYFHDAWTSFDWDGPDADADWEPVFGSRFFREFSRWMMDCGFSLRTCGGFTGITGIVAMTANTVPVCIWGLMELGRDPVLRREIRDEVEAASTGRHFDVQKLVTLPLLQSFYTEVMRLHVSVLVIREALRPFGMEGYTLPAGSILQAPSEISHYSESIWGVEGHPASEFWARRHISYGPEGKARFEMMGRPADFFPFGMSLYDNPGGGLSMCPGRHFAKQEILLTLAILVSRFDMEFVEWTTMDGATSDGPARNDPNYSGAVGVPPDRDMKLHLKRLW